MLTCGSCEYAVVDVGEKNLQIRVCYGAPPQMVVLPAQQGVQLVAVRPKISLTERACSMFKFKLQMDSVIDHIPVKAP